MRRVLRRWGWTCFFVCLAAANSWFRARQVDFEVFDVAGRRYLAGAPLYLQADGAFPFKYAPVIAALFSPLSFLPLRLARALWTGLAAYCLVEFLVQIREAADVHRRWVVPLAALLLASSITALIGLGQSDSLLMLLAILSHRSARERPKLSGALLGVASLIKPPLLLLALLPLAQRQWRRAGFTLVAIGGGLLLPALRYGWGGNLALHSEWLALLRRTTPPMLCSPQNQSLSAIACTYLAPLGSPSHFWPWVLGASALLGLGFAGSIWVRHRQGAPDWELLAFGSLCYLTAVISPLGWRTNLIALAPLLILGLATLERSESVSARAFVWIGCLALAVLATMERELVGSLAVNRALEIRLPGLLSLLAALLFAWSRVFLSSACSRASAHASGSVEPKSDVTPDAPLVSCMGSGVEVR